MNFTYGMGASYIRYNTNDISGSAGAYLYNLNNSGKGLVNSNYLWIRVFWAE